MIYGSQSLGGCGGGERESWSHHHSARNSYPGLKLINNGPHISDGFFQLRSVGSGSTFFAFMVDSIRHIYIEHHDQQGHKQHEFKDHTSSK